jgi:hypothetical protein
MVKIQFDVFGSLERFVLALAIVEGRKREVWQEILFWCSACIRVGKAMDVACVGGKIDLIS